MDSKTPVFLLLYSGYIHTQIALFAGDRQLTSISEHNKKSSKNLIPLIDTLFKNNNVSLADCAFLAAYQGPAPFTSLRVAIATLNGLGFATNLPLVGVDGLEAFIEEYHDETHAFTVALLNAFCDDVYFAIYQTDTGIIAKGCMNIELFLEDFKEIHQKSSGLVTFIGNAAQLQSDLIKKKFGDFVYFLPDNPEMASLATIGKTAYKNWQEKKSLEKQLLPLYLKSSTAQLSCKK